MGRYYKKSERRPKRTRRARIKVIISLDEYHLKKIVVIVSRTVYHVICLILMLRKQTKLNASILHFQQENLASYLRK